MQDWSGGTIWHVRIGAFLLSAMGSAKGRLTKDNSPGLPQSRWLSVEGGLLGDQSELIACWEAPAASSWSNCRTGTIEVQQEGLPENLPHSLA